MPLENQRPLPLRPALLLDEEQRSGNNASEAPRTAPVVVAISMSLPIRIFQNPSFTQAVAASEEVAITEINAAPMG